MDYTVGSIADLISGAKTPNKPKVKKILLQQQSTLNDDAPTNSHSQTEQKKKQPEFKTKKRQKKTKPSPSTGDSDLVVINPEMFTGLTQTQNCDDDKTTESIVSTIKTKKAKKRKVETDEAVKQKKRKTDLPANDDDNEIEKIEKPKKKKSKKTKEGGKKEVREPETIEAKHEKDSRTVFVGNIPISIKKRSLLRLFSKFGYVQSVRMRCISPAEPGISKKVAFIKKLMHPKRSTMHSYVTFTSREDAIKALSVNGMQFQDHHLRVQIANDNEKPDPRKAIFIGNLPFDIEDEELWSTFEPCGPIVYVRIVRDSTTNMGIGIAYVNFESADSVELALQMENVTIKKNVIRIHPYSLKKKHGQRHHNGEVANRAKLPYKKGFKRVKNYLNHINTSDDSTNKTTKPAVNNTVFQGSKSNIKKKKPKLNKGVIKKMKLSQKIAPR